MASEKVKGGSSGNGGKSRPPPPALNPESCALVQPYKDFIGRGFLSQLTVRFTPMGITVSCSVASSLLRSGETLETLIPLGDAKNRIIEKGLWSPGKPGGKKSGETSNVNALPKKSLCKDDFKENDDAVKARAIAVAAAIGDTTARGRIGSLDLMIEGVDTFEEWWSSAAAAEKTRLLSDKKHHDQFSESDHLRVVNLLGGDCPFRGLVPTPSQEKEEETVIKNGGGSSSTALVQKKKSPIRKS